MARLTKYLPGVPAKTKFLWGDLNEHFEGDENAEVGANQQDQKINSKSLVHLTEL